MRSLGRRLAVEFIGTAFLLLAVVGAATTAARLGASPAIGLLASAITVGGVLAALIAALGTVGDAHFNPAVSLGAVLLGHLPVSEAVPYAFAQVAGGVLGVVVAHAGFGDPLLAISDMPRAGAGAFVAETVATAGLVAFIFLLVRAGRQASVGAAVGAFVAGAHLFAASTGFANPAVTLARVFTGSPAGIDPGSVWVFLAGEVLGSLVAVWWVWSLSPVDRRAQPSRIIP